MWWILVYVVINVDGIVVIIGSRSDVVVKYLILVSVEELFIGIV